jgi:hypothetical protein
MADAARASATVSVTTESPDEGATATVVSALSSSVRRSPRGSVVWLRPRTATVSPRAGAEAAARVRVSVGAGTVARGAGADGGAATGGVARAAAGAAAAEPAAAGDGTAAAPAGGGGRARRRCRRVARHGRARPVERGRSGTDLPHEGTRRVLAPQPLQHPQSLIPVPGLTGPIPRELQHAGGLPQRVVGIATRGNRRTMVS